MQNLLKNKFVHSIGIYTFSNVLNSAIPFLLLPILTRYLKPEDYGILSNFNSLINILIPFVSLNLMTSLQVIFVKSRDDLPAYISSGLAFMSLLTVVFSFLLIYNAGELEIMLGVPERFIYFAAIYALYQNIVEVLLSVWRMEERAMLYGTFRVVRTIVELGLAIILVTVFGLSFDGSILALSYSYGLGALVALYVLYKKGILKTIFQWRHVVHLIKYGVPLIPHVLGGVIIIYSDKLFLTNYHGLASNGIYTVAFMVGQVIGLLQNSFNQAWGPYVFQKLKTGLARDKHQIVKWTYIYIVAIIIISLLFFLSSPIIFFFIGETYSSGIDIVLWIALGFAFNGMYKMVSIFFFYEEKTMQIAVISIGTAILNLILLFLWVPKHAHVGAAHAMMISMFFQFIVTWIWSTRITKMPWGFKKIE